MKLAWLQVPRSGRLGRVLSAVVLVVLIAAAINVVGIQLVGDIDHWTKWLDEPAGYFFAWRVCLYVGTAYGWWNMRRRLRARDASTDARCRLLRAEIGAVGALLLLEVSVWLR
jgi:succinate dehydrogenase hydrophobic anchor subunit